MRRYILQLYACGPSLDVRPSRPRLRRAMPRKRMAHRLSDLSVHVRCSWRGSRPAGVAPSQSRASGPRLDVRPESPATCFEQCSASMRHELLDVPVHARPSGRCLGLWGDAPTQCGRGLELSIKLRHYKGFITTVVVVVVVVVVVR